MKKDFDKFEVTSLKQLRTWLKKNYQQKESLWLVTYKKAVPEFYIEYSNIVDELLCFGWIDSLPRKLDENRKMLLISPRKPKSAWSKINRDKVKKLMASQRMHPSGLQGIKQAKKNGSWDLLKSVDSLNVPTDLKSAFTHFPKSKSHFDLFPPSSKRAILEWIAQAKTPETRKKRVTETARLASDNIRANHYRDRQQQALLKNKKHVQLKK